MNIFQLKDKVIEKLGEKRSDFDTSFDREKETLRIERQDNKKGINVSLSKAMDKFKKDSNFADEIVYYIDETLERMKEEEIDPEQAMIYPVVRSRSEEHTSELQSRGH